MNKVIRTLRTNGYHLPAASPNGHAGVASLQNGTSARRELAPVSSSRQQARALSSLLLGLTRELLAVDDVTADLPLRQLRVCALLHEGPRSMSVLSRELNVSMSATTQLADRLKRARLVKRVSEESDRRVRSLQLTPRGKRIMRIRESARVDRALASLEHLPPKSRREVLASLSILLKACNATRK